MRRTFPFLLSIVFAAVSCRPAAGESESDAEQVPIVVGSGTTSASSGGSVGGGNNENPASASTMRLASWNLHNFSKWGTTEYRIGDIADEIRELDADVLGVQELKVATDTAGEPPQAWDVLLEELPGYEGLHNPWNTFDTTVGLLYKPATTVVVSSRSLFEDDSYAFPRPALEAELRIDKGDGETELTVIVLHLKAFGDAVDRRRAACDKLYTYLTDKPDAKVVLLGDLNDDPYDAPAENAFLGTFVDAEPAFYFVTQELPPESVTSLGYYHDVGNTRIDGEFLDHFIITGAAREAFATVTPRIESVPDAMRDDFEQTHSDHFPVVLDLTP